MLKPCHLTHQTHKLLRLHGRRHKLSAPLHKPSTHLSPTCLRPSYSVYTTHGVCLETVIAFLHTSALIRHATNKRIFHCPTCEASVARRSVRSTDTSSMSTSMSAEQRLQLPVEVPSAYQHNTSKHTSHISQHKKTQLIKYQQ